MRHTQDRRARDATYDAKMSGNDLGDFLRARRSRLDPAEMGFPGTGARRVAGLRREEVAVLAGVSVDYYARLEQGRERHPSGPVLDAIAGALRLDNDGRGHAYRLAGLAPKPAAAQEEAVSPALLRLMDGFPMAVAYVINRRLEVLASNALADALLSPSPTPATWSVRSSATPPPGGCSPSGRRSPVTPSPPCGWPRGTTGATPGSPRW